MLLLNYLFNNAKSLRKKTGGTFSPVPRKWKLPLVSFTSWLKTNIQACVLGLRSFRRQRWHSEYLYESKIPRSLTKTFALPATQNKTKQIKTIRLNQSSITWMNHFKQHFKASLNKVLMSIWQNSKEVPHWSSTWKWNILNRNLNGCFDVLVPLGVSTNLIFILAERKMLKLI